MVKMLGILGPLDTIRAKHKTAFFAIKPSRTLFS